ncbi:hypothetical protein CL657_05055 [bacterium]|nr:hypothetical protein [bacterium]|tara:strand:- start:220 stop:594 length:375 start_codon:yes stop_codon:yes gene_type:complete
MSQVNELKKALENLSSKEHVISKEATFAKESIQESYQKKSARDVIEKQTVMMDEFNTSITLLMDIFSQSRFDSIMSFIANPLRLIIINFFIACFKGMGFAFGVIIVAMLLTRVFAPDLIQLFIN